MSEDKSQRRSMEEVLADIEAISKDSEHRDQFKALRMLASSNSSAVVLRAPMTEPEIIERLVRVMKPSGPNLCQLAYRKAFTFNKDDIRDAPVVGYEHLSDDHRAKVLKVRDLRSFYREFPEMKRPGVPLGFPSKASMEVRQKWCREKAAKILLDRERENLNVIPRPDGTQEP